jgi:hypothetical protein
MAIPKHVEVELEWRNEQIEMFKRFKRWIDEFHPEINKEYDNYILQKIIVGKVLGEKEAQVLVSVAAKAIEVVGEDELEKFAAEKKPSVETFKMRLFTKQDWYGFAGCEADDEHQPWIRGGIQWLGVCDKCGVGIYYDTGMNEDDAFFLESNYEMGKLILEALPDTVTKRQVIDLGFKKF